MDFSALAAGQYGNPMAAAGIQALTNAISGQGGGSNPYLAQALKQRQAGQGQPGAGSPNAATPAVPGAPQEQVPTGMPTQSPFMQQQGAPAQGQSGADPQMMQQLMQLMAARGVGG